jgi:hypothetical protein
MLTIALAAALPAALAAWAVAAEPAARTAEIPNAVIVVEAVPGTPGSDPVSAPPRFVLLKDGEVFVGGTGRLLTGRLEKAEAQALRRGAEAVRKAAGRGGALSLGVDVGQVVHVRLPEDGPAEITIAGDPATAPPALQPVASFVVRLLRFDHPSLTRYAPASYAVAVREGRLVGGCRPWRFAFPIESALASPRLVPAADAEGWPSGAWPASVCAGEKRYVVTLRPLLPGEQP